MLTSRFGHRHLVDYNHREVFESAHSCILAILAWYTRQVFEGKTGYSVSNFPRRIIPFYSKNLVENSLPGRLSTGQLRLAYSGLVRAAMVGGTTLDFALATDCVELLRSTARSAEEPAHRTRMILVLVSTLSALPIDRALPLLEDIRLLANDLSVESLTEISEAIYEEISERVSKEPRDVLIRWLLENAATFPRQL